MAIQSPHMKTCAEIRHDNLLALIDQAGSIQSVADTLGKDHAQISQLKTRAKHSKSGQPRLIGDEIARLIEEKFALEVGWMDHAHGPLGNTAPAAMTNKPVYMLDASWPFQTIRMSDVGRLSEFDRGQVEGFIKGLLQARDIHQKSNGTK